MISRAIIVGLCLVVLPSASTASEWAYGLFDSLDHDFGAVARGTQLTHRFTVTNNTSKKLRIKNVRVSCHCTKAEASKQRLSPGESTFITAVMDTSGFQGSKSVTVFVQFDKPHRAEIPLRVSCTSTGNIASSVNEVDFGVLAAGAGGEKKLQLNYPGKPDWQITSIDYGNPHLFAELIERSRTASDVQYELHIKLAKDTPAGKFQDRIRMHTNDAKAPHVLVDVHAQVEAELEIAPNSLPLKGAAGTQVTRNFVIKGQEPFRIVRVEESPLQIEVRSSQTPALTQLVVVTVTIPENGAALPDEIALITSLAGDKAVTIPLER